MGIKYISFQELSEIVESNGLNVIDDILISITNGQETEVIHHSGYLTAPPYSTLYSKATVMKIVNKLNNQS